MHHHFSQDIVVVTPRLVRAGLASMYLEAVDDNAAKAAWCGLKEPYRCSFSISFDIKIMQGLRRLSLPRAWSRLFYWGLLYNTLHDQGQNRYNGNTAGRHLGLPIEEENCREYQRHVAYRALYSHMMLTAASCHGLEKADDYRCCRRFMGE